jgi:hypothetical protein
MLKLVSKFALDIFPSVIATIIGAYIVNHYINNKPPAADASATAASVSPADPKKAGSRSDSKPAEKSADLGSTPEPGVRAKSSSDKSTTDKPAAEKPAEKAADKVDKPSETAGIPPATPAEPRRPQPAPREKAATRTAPATAPQPTPSTAEPVIAAPNTVAPAETGPDANDLARAAIERLHRANVASEPPRAPEPPRVMAAPAPPPAPLVVPPLQPLPPPIQVSTPPADLKPPYPPMVRMGDPQRPTPPADIPNPRPPLDLRADAVDAPQGRPSVAEDVLSAAKSVFNSVLPK